MKIYSDFSSLIGRTPLYNPGKFCQKKNIPANIYLKLEFFNPAGSIKDRVAYSMIDEAEKQGILKENSIIIEPTSGNTGIGLAAICASKGYRAVFTMPETMSRERISLLKAYGAQVILTPGEKGMQGAIEKAKEIANSTPGSFIPSQFENPANPQAHINTTGPEIWEDSCGKIDIFVACAGTGGTISGVGKYLKEKNPDIKIVVIEPSDSPLLSEGKAGPHQIQGIGANFIPKTLDTSIYDEIITVSTKEAYENAKLFAHTEGLLTGISSGAALFGAVLLASRPENAEKTIVSILPDSGERYLSTPLFD